MGFQCNVFTILLMSAHNSSANVNAECRCGMSSPNQLKPSRHASCMLQKSLLHKMLSSSQSDICLAELCLQQWHTASSLHLPACCRRQHAAAQKDCIKRDCSRKRTEPVPTTKRNFTLSWQARSTTASTCHMHTTATKSAAPPMTDPSKAELTGSKLGRAQALACYDCLMAMNITIPTRATATPTIV